ncbi:transposase [Desulfocurvibacter africanus]|uniref:transposase n=1 Tax=Desulfocurvibacter africanus TaxID=873 RepID=UPI0004811E72|nr:transposase [Desulfocurvibacter africanus]
MAKQFQLWRVSDQFWNMVDPLIPRPERTSGKNYRRRPGGGRKPLDPRRVFEAIVHVLRTGIPWKGLPTEHYGSSSSIHSYFQVWESAGFFDDLWRNGLAEHDDMVGIAWQWQRKTEPGSRAMPARNSEELQRADLSRQIVMSPEKVWRPVVIRREQCRF